MLSGIWEITQCKYQLHHQFHCRLHGTVARMPHPASQQQQPSLPTTPAPPTRSVPTPPLPADTVLAMGLPTEETKHELQKLKIEARKSERKSRRNPEKKIKA